MKVVEQFETALPPIGPITRIHVGCCEDCGRTVRPARHPLQTSDAVGVADVQLGPNALSLGSVPNKGFGLSWDEVSAFFERTFGPKAAASAFCRGAARIAVKLEPT